LARTRRRPVAQIVSFLLLASAARADPNLPYDDPRWIGLRDSVAKGAAPDNFGGVEWADDDRHVGSGWWATLFRRVTLRDDASDKPDRPYSLPLRPRDLEGYVSLSCEYQEGRPCGDGIRSSIELDSAVGLGSLLTAFTRVRAGAGTHFGDAVQLDRGYLKFEYGPLWAQFGRDVLALGPAVRGSLMVSANAVPQDGFRIQLRPVELPLVPVRLSVFYFIDRLRAPQRFSGTLADATRIQFDVGKHVQFGGTRLLEIGGHGAPYYGGFVGFIEEHFGRTREGGPGGTAENNRLSGDISVRVPSWRAARFYYEFAFEDTRKAFLNSVQYDADHLVGFEMRDLRVGPWRRLFVELTHTGWVSQEHGTFVSGMTNGGRTLGSALGPDATSFWVRADLELAGTTISPWAEMLRFGSAMFGSDQENGVFVTAPGPIEHRQRLGADFITQLPGSLSISGGVFAERIANADLVEGSTVLNLGFRVALTFVP
jgi:hypothetical protein